ncbi:MAG TPA: hypothetical protein VFG73_02525 [Rhodanobacteraceae bacterium]|nr:hypothetical protein [Rhodanobacteraceae bacterium]
MSNRQARIARKAKARRDRMLAIARALPAPEGFEFHAGLSGVGSSEVDPCLMLAATRLADGKRYGVQFTFEYGRKVRRPDAVPAQMAAKLLSAFRLGDSP